jgi:hypothetical protein
VQLALREQDAAEIIAGLGVIRLEQQQTLVEPGRFREVILLLTLGGVGKQLLDRIRCRRAPRAKPRRRALFERSAALFPIHPLASLGFMPAAGAAGGSRAAFAVRFQAQFTQGAGGRSDVVPSGLTEECSFYTPFHTRSCGRVAEGGGLLNRYTV